MTQRIDQLNCLLILLACFFAIAAPFGLLVLAYVLLGPLHYLTELVWLDERRYFLPRANDKRWLFVITIVGIVTSLATMLLSRAGAPIPSALAYHSQQLAITAALLAVAIPVVLWSISDRKAQMAILSLVAMAGAFCYYVVDAYSYFVLLAVMLPTVIHVYLFTAAFMFSGALKSNSVWGYIALVLLMVCGTLLFLFDLPGWSGLDTGLIALYYSTLGHVDEIFQSTLSPAASDRVLNDSPMMSALGLRISRFLAFAYTYHYLNWFSKTSLIGWHKMPRSGLRKIALLWFLCVALYAIDFSLGLLIVGSLSLLHVFCELPLNWRSLQTIACFALHQVSGSSLRANLTVGSPSRLLSKAD